LWAKAGRSDCESAAAAVASRLHEIDREAGVALFGRLGGVTADIVLGCDGLVLSDEDWLLGVILSLRDSADVSFERLLRHVRCRHLSGAWATAFLDALDLGSLDAEARASLCDRPSLEVKGGKCDRFAADAGAGAAGCSRSAFTGSAFEGVLWRWGANSAGTRTRGAPSRSRRRAPEEILDHGWGSRYCTAGAPNSWIRVDMKGRSISLEHYSLESHSAGDSFFKSWAIEGSEDVNSS